MQKELADQLKTCNLEYVELSDQALTLIYDLFCRGIAGVPTTGLENLYFGSYHLKVTKNYNLTVIYY